MKIFVIILCYMLFAYPSFAGFIDGLEDVPLAEGLTQIQSDNISFGNEESRLVEAVLIGEKTTFNQVESFYKNTLPQMGWIFQGMRGKTLVFEREGEVIEISKEETSPLKVRLTVKSKM